MKVRGATIIAAFLLMNSCILLSGCQLPFHRDGASESPLTPSVAHSVSSRHTAQGSGDANVLPSPIQSTSPKDSRKSLASGDGSGVRNAMTAQFAMGTTSDQSTGGLYAAGLYSGAGPDAADLVRYTGPVEHIFFHPLIAYPERAFDHDGLSQGYNDWFVTVSEFNKILTSLYDKGFILIDIRSLVDERQVGDKTVIEPKDLFLPQGKKPLILSIDDINYYDYMQQNGNVNRLVLDAQGRVATESTGRDGHSIISRDNEIVPILDDFVQNHPDFSFQGAKGLLDVTGYEGILGYRTDQLNSPNYTMVKDAAIKVVTQLKATGWTFASHSYGHLDDAGIPYARFVQDTNRWIKEVEPLIGPTPIYVYPFGSRVPTGGDKYEFLLKNGFQILCGVGPTSFMQYTKDSLMMDRRHIDGISLHNQRQYLLDLFDSRQVIDPIRPNNY